MEALTSRPISPNDSTTTSSRSSFQILTFAQIITEMKHLTESPDQTSTSAQTTEESIVIDVTFIYLSSPVVSVETTRAKDSEINPIFGPVGSPDGGDLGNCENFTNQLIQQMNYDIASYLTMERPWDFEVDSASSPNPPQPAPAIEKTPSLQAHSRTVTTAPTLAVTHADVSLEDAKKHKAQALEEHFRWLVMFSQYSVAGTGNSNLMLGSLARANSVPNNAHRAQLTGMGAQQDPDAKPKIIKRLAQQHEIYGPRDKEGQEARAKRSAVTRTSDHGFPCKIPSSFRLRKILSSTSSHFPPDKMEEHQAKRGSYRPRLLLGVPHQTGRNPSRPANAHAPLSTSKYSEVLSDAEIVGAIAPQRAYREFINDVQLRRAIALFLNKEYRPVDNHAFAYG
ncbi:hypothetical protein DM02DRAFT_663185 [Periconia macrospinosa]|uniref:Uncharacterized protein n=1 Tax=Periconia macrospinosa TaxID=97972 RepID=A0A2V1D2G4_9PLEO|nr:hypothetical protein DM02DRAFT_663185 [Periconia macrospinosa]